MGQIRGVPIGDRRARGRVLRRLLVAAGVGVLLPALAPGAAGAATACTPTGVWAQCTRFDYTGADQVYTVPAGVGFIEISVWGAAGAPGGDPALGGGFSTGTIPVTPGQQLTLTVGQGGARNSTVATYGGGGAGGSGLRDATPETPSWTIGGSGGGMSAVWDGALRLAIAGGSGASAPTRSGIVGGAGGGADGGIVDDYTGASGGGGSASAGGAGGTNGVCPTPGAPGAQYIGGAGSGGFDGGSGGGGGYFGGGGGSCQQDENDDNNEGAGGGGSGYVNTARVPGGTSTAAVGAASAGADDPHYVAGIGVSDGPTGLGGNGMIVIQAEAPAPTPVPITSSGAPGAVQQVTVAPPAGGAVYLRNATNALVSSVTTAAGIYTANPTTGLITYTPAAGFLGTAPPVTYVLVDMTDRRGESTYTVTVALPAAPAPGNTTSSAAVGAVQTVAVPVPVGGTMTLLDAAGAPMTTVTVAGEGTYTLGADGASIVFTPVARFAGQATGVRFTVVDQYGQAGTARYAPVVVAPAPPVAAARTSTGGPARTQSVTVVVPAGGSVTLLDATGAATTAVVLDGQGTYVLDPDTGTITFTPVRGFFGMAGAVQYAITDAFGQRSIGTYTATVARTELSRTGADPGSTGALAASALMAGAGMLLVRRRWGSR